MSLSECRHGGSLVDNFDHNDPRFYLDPVRAFDEIRQQSPVLYSSNYGGYWLLTRFADVAHALRDWERFSSVGDSSPTSVHENWPPTRPVRELPIASDPPEHSNLRALVAPWFARQRLAALEAPIRQIARDLLTIAATNGGCDVVQDLAIPFVLGGLAHFLGRPPAEAALYRPWAEGIFLGRSAAPVRSDAARVQLLEWVEESIQEARCGDSEDFFRLLIDAEINGRSLDYEEALGFGALTFLAGVETTVNAVSISFHHFATHQRDLQRLRDNGDLIPGAIEELLRFRSPVQLLGRRAAVDVELGGMTIRQGDGVAVCYGAANGDGAKFQDPGRYVLDRHPNPHLAFGAGRHLCLGLHLARLEIRVVLEEALAAWGNWELSSPGDEVLLPRGDLHGFWRLPVKISGIKGDRGAWLDS